MSSRLRRRREILRGRVILILKVDGRSCLANSNNLSISVLYFNLTVLKESVEESQTDWTAESILIVFVSWRRAARIIQEEARAVHSADRDDPLSSNSKRVEIIPVRLTNKCRFDSIMIEECTTFLCCGIN